MNRGFSFVEIVIGIMVFGVLSLPILWMMSSTRADTSRAISYLRALEIAQETIDLINITPISPEFEKKVTSLTGSLVKNEGGKFGPVSIPLANNDLYPTDARDLSYSDQYGNAFFHRTVEVAPVEEAGKVRLLKRVTVTVRWSEGKVPGNLETTGKDDSVRNKKVSLSVLVVDKNGVY